MNKYIDETAPWVLAKDEDKKLRLATVMNMLVESLYKIAVVVAPYMPTSAQKIWNQLGFEGFNIQDIKIEDIKNWGALEAGHKLGNAEPIFPRLELEKEEVVDPFAINENLVVENPVAIDDFSKTKIQVVEILEVSKVEGADKLLKFKVSLGDHARQIISGIARYYPEPQELVGKKVLAVTNLSPVKLRGELSQGMLLSSEEKNRLKLVEVDSSVKVG
ncbi:MAG: methionine--tRNA ligase subunit beta, partial [Cetobacterium sp.]